MPDPILGLVSYFMIFFSRPAGFPSSGWRWLASYITLKTSVQYKVGHQKGGGKKRIREWNENWKNCSGKETKVYKRWAQVSCWWWLVLQNFLRPVEAFVCLDPGFSFFLSFPLFFRTSHNEQLLSHFKDWIFSEKVGKARHLNTQSHAAEPGTWRTADSTEPGTWVSAQHWSHLTWLQMLSF